MGFPGDTVTRTHLPLPGTQACFLVREVPSAARQHSPGATAAEPELVCCQSRSPCVPSLHTTRPRPAHPEAPASRACTPHGRGPHIPKPLSPEPAHHTAEARTSRSPCILSLHTTRLRPTGCNHRAHRLQRLEPRHLDVLSNKTTAMRSLQTAAKSIPPLTSTRESPREAIKTQHSHKRGKNYTEGKKILKTQSQI